MTVWFVGWWLGFSSELVGCRADEFYTTKGVEKLELPEVAEGKREGVNCMIFTTTEVPDLKTFFPALAPQAWIIPLTAQMKDLAIPYVPLSFYILEYP